MRQSDQVTGFVLAGGASSRMGRDKALLELDGIPLVLRTARLLEAVVTRVAVIGRAECYARLGVQTLPDDFPGCGPLGGIATALRSSHAAWSLVVACDLPYLTPGWLEYLVGRARASTANVVVPESARGLEPLCAMYHERSKAAITAMLERGLRKVSDALAGLPAGTVEKITEAGWKAFDSQGWLFKNMNSPADYKEARERLETKQGPRARL